jgi:DNA mismatch endonuclease, patch repair protein
LGRRPRDIVSYNMSRIRSKGSKIEQLMSSALREAGLRGYRKHAKDVVGKPDFVWKSKKIAVFCDSAFWHGYKWDEEAKKTFKVRKRFWINKIERNRERDKEVNTILRKQGWKILRFWDKQIKRDPSKCAGKVKKYFKSVG